MITRRKNKIISIIMSPTTIMMQVTLNWCLFYISLYFIFLFKICNLIVKNLLCSPMLALIKLQITRETFIKSWTIIKRCIHYWELIEADSLMLSKLSKGLCHMTWNVAFYPMLCPLLEIQLYSCETSSIDFWRDWMNKQNFYIF